MATLAEILAELPKSIAEDAISGVEHSSVDGVSITMGDLLDRLEVLDRLREEASGKNNSLGLKMVALNAPMGGGRP